MNAEDAAVNVMLRAVAHSHNPQLYSTRLRESEDDRNSWSTVLPIFYYNQALFPGSRLSLHLFEPRYKLMMQRIVTSSRAFAYVPNYSNYTASAGDVALIAELEEAEFLADGRCLLEAKMKGRYRIVDHYVENGTQGLHYCRLEPLFDDLLTDDDAAIVNGLRSIATRLLSSLFDQQIRAQVESQCGPEPADNSIFSLWLTGITPVPERMKAELLRSKQTRQRMELCVQALGAIIGQQQPTPVQAEDETVDEPEPDTSA